MKTLLRKFWKMILLVLPFVLGMIGLLLTGEPLLQAVYKCLCMYGMGYSDLPANLWIELARWLAPLATASSLLLIIAVLRKSLRRFIARCTGKSVAVYGPQSEKAPVLEELGLRGIDMEKAPVKAHRYILLGTEEENLEFYRQHRKRFADRDVYIKCQALPAQASSDAKLHLFCPEETAARFFWKENCLYSQSVQQDHQLQIVFLGFGKLGKELLLSGLQNNIFAPDQKIEYHIFGQEEGFTDVYRQLSQISDPVTFHAKPWYEEISLLEQADMIIVAEQQAQLALLRDLTLTLPGKTVYVLADDPDGVALLENQGNVIAFDWKQQTRKLENILGTRLHEYAKRINLRYAHLYGGVPENDSTKEAEWLALDAFTRYSNISAADYHDVRLRMLDGTELTPEKIELLAELEHIRWCRYHYLNNWKHGQVDNGKAKDMQKRIHKCLVEYARLDEADKEKDRENIRILLALDKEETL